MGLIKEKVNKIVDSYDKYIQCEKMDDNTLIKKYDFDINNKIVVDEDQYLLITCNDEIIDSINEAGIYTFKEESKMDVMNIYFINTSNISDNKFKTEKAIQYFDSNLNIMVDIKCYGEYIIKIIDPIKFYKYNKNTNSNSFKNLFLSKFLENLESTLSKLSEKKLSYDAIPYSTDEITKVFNENLKLFNEDCGVNIISVSIASVTPTIESFELIKQFYKQNNDNQNICPYCETELPVGAKFCFKCGKKI